MTGFGVLYSTTGVLRFSRNSKMDKIECFVAGVKLASGIRWQDSVIHAHVQGAFEQNADPGVISTRFY